MTTRNLPVRSEAVNTAAKYPVTPLAPYFYYSSYGLGDQIQRRHLEVSKETPFAIFKVLTSLTKVQPNPISYCMDHGAYNSSWIGPLRAFQVLLGPRYRAFSGKTLEG